LAEHPVLYERMAMTGADRIDPRAGAAGCGACPRDPWTTLRPRVAPHEVASAHWQLAEALRAVHSVRFLTFGEIYGSTNVWSGTVGRTV
jgi:hypothetical protein